MDRKPKPFSKEKKRRIARSILSLPFCNPFPGIMPFEGLMHYLERMSKQENIKSIDKEV